MVSLVYISQLHAHATEQRRFMDFLHIAAKMIAPVALLVIITQVLLAGARPMTGSVIQDKARNPFMKRSVMTMPEAADTVIRRKRQAIPTTHGNVIYVPQWMFLFKDLWENIIPYQPDMEHFEYAFEHLEPGFEADFDSFGNPVLDHDMFPERPDGYPDIEGNSNAEFLDDAADTFAETHFNEDILGDQRDAVENFITGEQPEFPEGLEHPFEQPDIPDFTDAVTGDIEPFETANEAHEHIENAVQEHIENAVEEFLSTGELDPVQGIEPEVSDFLADQFNSDDLSNSNINDDTQNAVLPDESHFENGIEPFLSSDGASATEEDGANAGSSEFHESQTNNEFETPETIEPNEGNTNAFETASEYFNAADDITDNTFDNEHDLSEFFHGIFGVYGDILADFRDSVAELQEHSTDFDAGQPWDHQENNIEGENGFTGNNEGEPVEHNVIEFPEKEKEGTEFESTLAENELPNSNVNHIRDQSSAEAETQFNAHEEDSDTGAEFMNRINTNSFVPSPSGFKQSADGDFNSSREGENNSSNENENAISDRWNSNSNNGGQSSAENGSRNIFR